MSVIVIAIVLLSTQVIYVPQGAQPLKVIVQADGSHALVILADLSKPQVQRKLYFTNVPGRASANMIYVDSPFSPSDNGHAWFIEPEQPYVTK